MATDVKQQVIAEIKSSPMFSIQIDESTDVASCSQLLVFVRYIHMKDVNEEFLYCKALETSATAQDVMDSISNFFDIESLQWEKLCGVCTDGAPAMLGCKSGLQMKVKEKPPEGRRVHCMIHQYTLACKTLPNFLKKVLNSVVKIVNFIKKSATTSRRFKQFCKEMDTNHETLLYYTAVLHSMLTSYPKLSTEALRVIVPFASTYFCESGFSALMHIKSKARNQLDVKDDMRIAISNTQPRISRLACNMQQQKSH